MSQRCRSKCHLSRVPSPTPEGLLRRCQALGRTVLLWGGSREAHKTLPNGCPAKFSARRVGAAPALAAPQPRVPRGGRGLAARPQLTAGGCARARRGAGLCSGPAASRAAVTAVTPAVRPQRGRARPRPVPQPPRGTRSGPFSRGGARGSCRRDYNSHGAAGQGGPRRPP